MRHLPYRSAGRKRAVEPTSDQELDMLDTLPELTDNSRLACQIPIQENINGLVVKVLTE
jgi:ferredoxin